MQAKSRLDAKLPSGDSFPPDWYRNLLVKGTFGPIALGASKDDVLAELGTPEDDGPLGRNLTLVAYANRHLQLSFHRKRLVHFGLYLNPDVSIRSLGLSTATSVESFCAFLQRNGIEEATYDEGLSHVRLPSRLTAVFESGRLVSLQRS